MHQISAVENPAAKPEQDMMAEQVLPEPVHYKVIPQLLAYQDDLNFSQNKW